MESLRFLAFDALTIPNATSGYSLFLAACVEGNCEEVRNILAFSPSLLDTLIALKTPALERAGPQYADKTPTDVVTALNTPPHQAIQEMLQKHAKSMEDVSLIHLAAIEGTARHIRRLVSRGLGAKFNRNSNNKSEEFSTPLCLAAGFNKTDVVQELLSQGAKLHKRDYREFNASHFAARSGSTENLMCLLHKDFQLKDSHLNGRASLLHLAARGGHTETVEALIKIGLNVNEPVEYNFSNFSREEDEMEDEVDLESAFSLFSCDREYEEHLSEFDIFTERATPLLLAAKSGNIETVQLLISKGAVIQARDKNNCSALFYACNGGQFLMAQFLIKEKLEVIRTCDVEDRSLLHVVNDVETAELLISDYGLKIDICDNFNRSPLHYAAERGNISVSEYLIKHGAQVNKSNDGNASPLKNALLQRHCNPEMVSLLLGSGSLLDLSSYIEKAFYKLDTCIGPEVAKLLIEAGYSVNTHDRVGRTLLHLAARLNFETTKLLIELGADINKRDDEGNLPIQGAFKKGQTDTIRLLLEQGSKVDV